MASKELLYALPHFLAIFADSLAQFFYEIMDIVLPVALPVMGTTVVVGIGVKVFKRFIK